MASLRQRPWWTGAVTGAVALAVVASAPTALVAGGLAPIAVAALIAALIGVPVARAEWRDRAALAGPIPIAIDGLGEVLLLAWLGAVWAVFWPGAQGALAGTALWVGALGLVTLRRDMAVVALGSLCAVQVVLAASLGAVEAPPWTLLQPQWDGWREWLPWSLISGLLLSGSGLAHWRRGREAPPGTSHVPWLPTGLTLLVVLGAACRAGSRFESDLGWVPDPLALGVVVLALGTAASAALAARGPRRGTGAATGIAATVWFALPAAGAVDWMLWVWLPLGMALVLGHHAWRRPGASRIATAAGAGLALLTAWLGWPGVPESPPAAVAAALSGVAILWVAGTRALVPQ